MNEQIVKECLAILGDDFNTEKAIALIFQVRGQMSEAIKKKDLEGLKQGWATLRCLCTELLGIFLKPRLDSTQIEKIKMKLFERDTARKGKDWGKADAIRKELESGGFSVEDTPLGPVVKACA